MNINRCNIEDGARIFGQAANTLGVLAKAALKADEFTGKEIISQNIIPSIVLKAFSSELFLKSIVYANDIPKIHKLDDLFELIGNRNKKDIQDSIIKKMQHFSKQYNENNFSTDLSEVANAFIDWRYFFEGTRSININFLDSLFYTLWEHSNQAIKMKS